MMYASLAFSPNGPGLIMTHPSVAGPCGPLRDIDVYVFAFDNDMVRGLILRRWRAYNLPGGHVELGAVPWAGDDRSVQIALAERTTLMGARPTHCIDSALHVEDRHLPPGHLNMKACAGRNLAQGCHLDQLAHQINLQPS